MRAMAVLASAFLVLALAPYAILLSGQGFGGEMLSRALCDARTAGAPRVTLCVDDRNAPAWRLYRRMGFLLYDSREVYLTVWRRAS